MARDISTTTTVRDIATAHPELLGELERLRIDYCCNGSRPLAEAAARVGLDAHETAQRLATFDPAPDEGTPNSDWSAASMTELADHIEETHHVFAREVLERLEALTGKCVAAHGDEEPRLAELQRVVAALTEDMLDHLVREERVLFPWLRRLERPTEIQSGPPWSVRRPIDCMIHDHDDVGEAFARVRELTDGLTVPEGACSIWRECYRLLADLERDTHLHIHKENNILFPAGVAAEDRRGGGPARRPVRPPVHGRGFTLIELLVVIAIIALLISILLPALGKTRSAGRSVDCLTHTRSIATAMSVYADGDNSEFFPTARMSGMPMDGKPAAPFTMSWIYLLGPYVGVRAPLPKGATADEIRGYVNRIEVCKCPEDHTQNWDATVIPRLASYGINAYLTPNHPPYWGVRASQIDSPSRCVLGAELARRDGYGPLHAHVLGRSACSLEPDDPAAALGRRSATAEGHPAHRHGGRQASYVFSDGHAGSHPFSDTWVQTRGFKPERNWYDPKFR